MKTSIPWLRMLAEGFAIVVSILLSFGIQAWREGRGEGGTLGAALENRVSEVEAGRTELSVAVEDNRSRIELYRQFMNPTPEEVRALPTDSLQTIGWSFFPPRNFDPGGVPWRAFSWVVV